MIFSPMKLLLCIILFVVFLRFQGFGNRNWGVYIAKFGLTIEVFNNF